MTALVQLTEAQRAVAEVETPADAKALYDKLEALSQYAKRYLRNNKKQNEIADAKLRTARKGGALLNDSRSAPLLRDEATGVFVERDAIPEGMTRSQADRWQALAGIADEKFEQFLAETKASEEEAEITLAAALRLAKRERPRDPTPPAPEGQYRTIVADPPWPVDTTPRRPRETGPRKASLTELDGRNPMPYPTMAIEEIAALPVKEWAAPDSHLYLWTINAHIEDAYTVARAWGFQPSTLLVWCKRPMGLGLGGAFTITTEYILFARRGSLASEQRIDSSWFEWKRGRHSTKPSAFLELVERVSPGPRVEMFARQVRDGWDSWGSEVADAA